MHISLSTIKQIELLTHGQSENSLWYDFRKCVVTASIAHDAQTKVAKLEKDMTPDFWSLFQKVCGNAFVSPNIPALKYGREMEPIAATKFIDIFSKTHKNIKVDTCGLYLHSSFPFIGASPDGIVHCSCCESACLEIKCPYSINYTSPTNLDLKLPYLKFESDKFSLNKNHKYFTQCQLQMAVTNTKKCYFFVWTSHGYIVDEIDFDKEFCDLLLNRLKKFYSLFLDFTYSTKKEN